MSDVDRYGYDNPHPNSIMGRALREGDEVTLALITLGRAAEGEDEYDDRFEVVERYFVDIAYEVEHGSQASAAYRRGFEDGVAHERSND